MLVLVALTSCQSNRPTNADSPPEPTANPAIPAPPPPPKGAYLGGISPDVLANVSQLPVMAPAYLPPGFVLADYRVEGAQAYSFVYRNPAAQCFAIEYQQQIPPLPETSGLAVETFDFPAFGATQEFYYALSSQAEPTGPLFSQWLSNTEGSYRFTGAENIAQNYPAQRACQNVSLEEAVKIITSIADLNASTTTK